MRILHTADWHIGKTLYRQQKRYDEFEAFLSWLADTLEKEKVDALLIAGDVFDTGAPSNRAQQLYYKFLCQVAASSCRHVVVIAGNHDSPSFLNAPKELLRSLDIHVVSAVSENLEDEVILLKSRGGSPEMIICAVPYLRDRDIRLVAPGESMEDKQQKVMDGIAAHYRDVCLIAENMRKQHGQDLPIVAMGHLFAAGGETVEGDGVRELYIGNLGHVSGDIFPSFVDYVALGHLHVPQKLQGNESIRYSGSPIPMGFGEVDQDKHVCLIEFDKRTPKITLISVPVFQELKSIRGSWIEIEAELSKLREKNSSAWLEIIYIGTEAIDLTRQIESLITGSSLVVLKIKNMGKIQAALSPELLNETLDDLSVHEVFERCLNSFQVPKAQHPLLREAYQETLLSLYTNDSKAE